MEPGKLTMAYNQFTTGTFQFITTSVQPTKGTIQLTTALFQSTIGSIPLTMGASQCTMVYNQTTMTVIHLTTRLLLPIQPLFKLLTGKK